MNMFFYQVQKAKIVDEPNEDANNFKAFTGTAVRLDGKPLKPTQQITDQSGGGASSLSSASSSSSSSSLSSSSSSQSTTSGGHNWGEGVGSLKSGNIAAAERRAAMLAAAEKRNVPTSSSSSLSSASTLTSSPPKSTKPVGPTKWSKSAKIGRFQDGGNRLVLRNRTHQHLTTPFSFLFSAPP
jgi:hypothetical protein